MPQNLPTTWIGILALVVVLALPPSIAALVAVWQSRRTRTKVAGVQTSVDGVTEQVANQHTTNLRDDITRLIEQGTENAHMVKIVKEYVEQKMPSNTDIVAIHTSMSGIGSDVRQLFGRLDALEQRFTEREHREKPGGAPEI